MDFMEFPLGRAVISRASEYIRNLRNSVDFPAFGAYQRREFGPLWPFPTGLRGAGAPVAWVAERMVPGSRPSGVIAKG
ncbi:hypothetical protein [Mycobacterium sp. NPDC050441]|uniref:hypothetical protein n=1 Tax=Mycobacterium sp. NPDC050441 TaxID=3155403 RepID=UPI0033DE4E44